MCKKSKQEYLDAIRTRYLSSSKVGIQNILLEVYATSGYNSYNRKYVIRVLNRKKKSQTP